MMNESPPVPWRKVYFGPEPPPMPTATVFVMFVDQHRYDPESMPGVELVVWRGSQQPAERWYATRWQRIEEE